MCSVSVSTQVWVICGEPSRIKVATWQGLGWCSRAMRSDLGTNRGRTVTDYFRHSGPGQLGVRTFFTEVRLPEAK